MLFMHLSIEQATVHCQPGPTTLHVNFKVMQAINYIITSCEWLLEPS